MSEVNIYEDHLDDWLSEQNVLIVQRFICQKVKGLVEQGHFSKYTDEPKKVTWLSKITNDLLTNKKDEKFYEQRSSIILRTGFQPFMKREKISDFNKNKFKSVENLLDSGNSITPTAKTCKIAIAIFGLDILEFEKFKTNCIREINAEKNVRSKISSRNILAWGALTICVCLVFYGVKEHLLKRNRTGYQHTIQASNLFTKPYPYKDSIHNTLELTSETFYWKYDQSSETHLDSLVIRFQLLNSTSESFFVDKIMFQTGNFIVLPDRDLLNIKTKNIIIPPSVGFRFELEKANWMYSTKIIKDSFHSLPANSFTSGLILVKPENKWNNERLPFTVILEGQHNGKNRTVSIDKWINIGTMRKTY
jgi:hypothetical protein